MMKWLDSQGKYEDIVISTRFRLARNFEKYLFPNSIGEKEAEELTNQVINAIDDKMTHYHFYPMSSINNLRKNYFLENQIISKELINNSRISSFLLRDDEEVSIMINEEDHLRIQSLRSGFDLDSFNLVNQVDDKIAEKMFYAYSLRYGYKTSCPSNVGTGLRASCMLHLPALTMTGSMPMIIGSIKNIGFTVRGIHGEGSKVIGSLYQVSNQRTLGESEEAIIAKLNQVVRELMDRERSTRDFLLERRRLQTLNSILESFGVCKYTRMIDTEKAFYNLSNIKLGVDLSIIKGVKTKDITKLMYEIQAANLQFRLGREMNPEERDIARADYIRDFFEKMEV